MANFSDLPAEVIVLIFRCYSESEGQRNLILRISRVCLRWKEICLSSSALWTKYDGSLNFGKMKSLCKKGTLSNTKELILSKEDELSSEDAKQLFSSLKNVEIINLSQVAKFAKDTFSTIADNCSKLKKIQVGGESKQTCLSYNLMLSFFALRGQGLTTIELFSCFISNMQLVIRRVADCCPNLEELHLRNCSNGMFPTKYFQKHCPKLKVLHLDYCIRICQERDPVGFPSLEVFTYLCNNLISISDKEFDSITFNSPNLKFLNLTNSGVSCVAMCSIPASSVEYLYIPRSRMINAKDFGDVLQRWCNSLKQVDVAYASSSSINKALLNLIELPTQSKLEILNLNFSQVLPSTVEKIVKACTQLEMLHLEGCRNLKRGMKRTYNGKSKLESLSRNLEMYISSNPSITEPVMLH